MQNLNTNYSQNISADRRDPTEWARRPVVTCYNSAKRPETSSVNVEKRIRILDIYSVVTLIHIIYLRTVFFFGFGIISGQNGSFCWINRRCILCLPW